MENLIIQVSRYILIILLTIYTIYCFTVFRYNNKDKQKRMYWNQRLLIYMIHFVAHGLLYLNTKNMQFVFLYFAELVFVILVSRIYRLVYKNLSNLILNNMLMLIIISFTMLGRLNTAYAKRQLIMASLGFVVCLIVPFVIEKFKYLAYLGWVYAGLGIVLLLLVFIPGIGVEKYGSLNWIQIGAFVLQPSEFAKIIFVFFIAALLSNNTAFKRIVLISIVAASYVLVLVAEKDLGGALLFVITYLSMLYVATQQPLYLVSGVVGITAAGTLAYKLFSHVRIRFQAWMDPFQDINDGGYQICSSLFAIGTGGWFGLGLGKGLPTSIPVEESDFIFSAISEEFGGIFALCMVMIYISCFIMFVNIAMKMKNQFYKLTAFGLSVIFIFQVFLNIGGVIKFIPSTGITLPLVSYGGSSILSIITIFSIIQGMYVLNQEGRHKKDEADEREEA
ncbi:MAG: FtsW/RodA/SpoVE family cell cycle protein [Velocimicrobium sp.]